MPDHMQVQVKFFLDHWSEIRASDAMRNIWQQIRLGRHPGYEEGWSWTYHFDPALTFQKSGL
jgi:hypothetical protein